MKGEVRVTLLLWLLSAMLGCNGVSSPGKPFLTKCRSPDKETFICWWEPGSDGGLPTTHHLYYHREDLEGVQECPDYMTAGRNACFFNKGHTSLWVNYNLTVVASNALGSISSDPLEVDVMFIMQPNSPENVTVFVEGTRGRQYLRITWEPPHNVDHRTGWVTVVYQLRVKQEGDSEWEEHLSGKQTEFSIYSLHPGVVYMVEVRCKLDHGYWSEWTPTAYSEVPNYFQNETPARILAATFSAFALVMMCILVIKWKCVKRCLLPPVPGPKISGFDAQLFKNGLSEDVLNSLIVNHSFPTMVACKDQMEACLVFDSDECFPLDSKKTKKRGRSFTIPSSFQVESGAHNNEPDICENDREKTVEEAPGKINIPKSSTSPYVNEFCLKEQFEVSTQEQSSVSKYVSFTERRVKNKSSYDGEPTFKKSIGCTDGGGYLDKENPQELDEKQEGYSRVTEVCSDNVLLSQQETVLLSSSSSKAKDNYLDCSSQRQWKPYVPLPTEGVCVQLIDDGYVDTMPSFMTL